MEESPLQQHLLEAIPNFMAGVAPGVLLRKSLTAQPLLSSFQPKAILSLGKAAGAMTQTLADIFSIAPERTLSILPEGYPKPSVPFPVHEGSHPLPDPRSLEALGRVQGFINTLPTDAAVIVALSGGSSSLVAAPLPPVTLSDKIQVTRHLMEAGAPIDTVNSLRLHLSRFKGGGLAEMLGPRPHTTFVLSDIPGRGSSLVGSSPMTPVSRNGPRILEEISLFLSPDKIPPTVRELLLSLSPKEIPPHTFPEDPLRIVGSSVSLIQAMKEYFLQIPELTSYPLHTLTAELCGEAREAGRVLASLIAWGSRSSLEAITGSIWAAAGETTVTLSGTPSGKGGRTLELALSLSMALSPIPALVLTLASDGFDGNSGLAGALVPTSFFFSPRRRLEGEAALQLHDAGGFLERQGLAIRTGPSGTNVNDLVMVIVSPSSTTQRSAS